VFYDAVSLKIRPLLWQYITEEVFKKMIQAKLMVASSSDTLGEAVKTHDQKQLTFEEKNASKPLQRGYYP